MESKKIPLLEKDDIEVRIQQACKGNKALALLYKTSRTDMRILDEVFGIYGWKDEYKEIKGNLYCGISIYDESKKEWITKWDCGIESQQDDGNERKAEASDALKRAGFKLGIGRELYSAPMIFISAETEVVGKTPKGKDKYGLVNPFEKYSVSRIAYNDRREIAALQIVDSKNNNVFDWTLEKGQTHIKPTTATTSPDSNASKNEAAKEEKSVTTQTTQSNGMTMEQALAYKVSWGVHKGKAFKDMPENYLKWIVEKNENAKTREAARLVLKNIERAKKEAEGEGPTYNAQIDDDTYGLPF